MPDPRRFSITVQILLDEASRIQSKRVSSTSYLFGVVQLLGQVQQTRLHNLAKKLSFGEEISFEAQFETSWTERDIPESVTFELCQIYQKKDAPTLGMRLSLGIWTTTVWNLLFSSVSLDSARINQSETVLLQPSASTFSKSPIRLSFCVNTQLHNRDRIPQPTPGSVYTPDLGFLTEDTGRMHSALFAETADLVAAVDDYHNPPIPDYISASKGEDRPQLYKHLSNTYDNYTAKMLMGQLTEDIKQTELPYNIDSYLFAKYEGKRKGKQYDKQSDTLYDTKPVRLVKDTGNEDDGYTGPGKIYHAVPPKADLTLYSEMGPSQREIFDFQLQEAREAMFTARMRHEVYAMGKWNMLQDKPAPPEKKTIVTPFRNYVDYLHNERSDYVRPPYRQGERKGILPRGC